MARIWKEQLDPDRHRDYMRGFQDAGGVPIDPKESDGWVYFVRECSFTFQFASLRQLAECRDYFEQKLHPARKRSNAGIEHYWQRWYERLPAGLIRSTKREKILRALEKALTEFGS